MRQPEVAQQAWKDIFAILDTGKFRPATYTTKKYVGLESLPGALDDLGNRRTWGKVIVDYVENAEDANARL